MLPPSGVKWLRVSKAIALIALENPQLGRFKDARCLSLLTDADADRVEIVLRDEPHIRRAPTRGLEFGDGLRVVYRGVAEGHSAQADSTFGSGSGTPKDGIPRPTPMTSVLP